MNPEVSIITPAYNCSKTIKETYSSISKQTFSSWEWIVIEDNSTDDSFEIISELAQNDHRIILLRTEKNSGAAVARNAGIKIAKGRFIAFLDADDLWKEDKLKHQVKFMKDNFCVLTYSNYELLYESGKIKHYKTKKDKSSYKDLLRHNNIGCLTAMYDSEALGKVFMPLDCEKREDHGMWLDITRKGVIAYKIPEELSIYRVCGSSVSSNKVKMIKYQYRLFRKHEHFSVFKSLWYLFLCTVNKLFRKY